MGGGGTGEIDGEPLALGRAALAWGIASVSLSLTAVTKAAEAANSDPTVAARTAKEAARVAVTAATEEAGVAYPRVARAPTSATLATRCRGHDGTLVPGAAREEAAPPATTRRPSVRAAERIRSEGKGGEGGRGGGGRTRERECRNALQIRARLCTASYFLVIKSKESFWRGQMAFGCIVVRSFLSGAQTKHVLMHTGK